MGTTGGGTRKSRYQETAELMDEALLRLLEQKELPFITVKDICRRAGVSRSTFYLHYETVGDLLSESVAFLNRRFSEHMETRGIAANGLPSHGPAAGLDLVTPRYLIPYLEFVRDNKRLFATALARSETLDLHGTYAKLYQSVLSPILDRRSVPEADRPYLMAFYLAGLIAIVRRWLDDDCKAPVEHVAELMRGAVRGGGGN